MSAKKKRTDMMIKRLSQSVDLTLDRKTSELNLSSLSIIVKSASESKLGKKNILLRFSPNRHKNKPSVTHNKNISDNKIFSPICHQCDHKLQCDGDTFEAILFEDGERKAFFCNTMCVRAFILSIRQFQLSTYSLNKYVFANPHHFVKT